MSKLVLCLLILIMGLALGMGVACASENLDSPSSVDESRIEVENAEVLSLSEDNALENLSSGFEDNLKASNNPVLTANEGTFTELQELINNNYNKTIVLNKNYAYDGGFNKNGIQITGQITIDGNNTVLDGKHQGRIFYIQASNVILKNIKFINGHSADDGGAVFWAGSDGLLSDSSFTGNNASRGGAVFWNADVGVLNSSRFINNVAGRGGAVFWNADVGVLSDSLFIDNGATNDGGGAVFWNADVGVLGGSNFTQNFASVNGGAVFWNATNGTLSDSNFEDNNASHGGAVFWYGANGRLSGSSFIKNFAGSGGAVYWDASNGLLSGSNFDVNFASVNGGAVYWNVADGRLSGSNFEGNNANLGGAVYWHGVKGNLTASNFTSNHANYSGGAVYWDGDNGVLSGSSFIDNFVDLYGGPGYGGAVFWDGDNGVLSGSSFIINSALYGGAIYWFGAKGNLSGSNFTDSFASGNGGAIYWFGDYGVLSASCFIDNSAANGDGGAVFWRGANGHLIGSNFTDNIVASGDGGAVFWYGAIGRLSGSSFIKNFAGSGGAVFWYGANGLLSGSNFDVNFASVNGGAVFWNAGDGILGGSTFTGNNASCGGAVYWDAANGHLIGSNFDVNFASVNGGAVFWYGVNGLLSGSSFIKNFAGSGGAVFWYCANGLLSGSNFDVNFASVNGGAVFWNATDGILGGSTFTGNNASCGGAVFWNATDGLLSGSNFTNNSGWLGGAIYSECHYFTIDVAYFNENTATKGSTIYKSYFSDLVITNSVFGRNRANSDKIVIEVEGNETNDVTVKITFYGNDNIANAIWNNGTLESVKLANITCEFSYNGTGREYKTFNKYDAPKAVNNTFYVDGSDELWQNPLENAQLLDINITDANGDIVYSIINGTETRVLGVERNILGAVLPVDSKPVTVTDINGKISIKMSNIKYGSYKISAKHQDDDYYTMAANSNSFFINNAALMINKTADVSVVGNNSLVNYTITVKNNGTRNATNVTIIDLLPQNLTYVDWSIIESNGAVITKVSNNVWGVSKIANSSFVSIWITAKVNTNTSGTITNTVNVNCIETPRFETGNADIIVAPVNLTIVKSANPDNLTVFDNLTFTITVANNALIDATNIDIIDDLDGAFIFDGKSTNYNCIFDNDKITWTIASLAKGESVTIVFNVTANKVGAFENTATVSCSENKTNKNSTTKVTINGMLSFVNATNVTVTYGEPIVVNVTSINAKGIGYEVIDQNNNVVARNVLIPDESITGLDLAAGKYTVIFQTIVDEYHTKATYTSFIAVNKAPSSVKSDNITVIYGETIMVDVISVNATGVSYVVVDENNVVVANGTLKSGEAITGLDLAAGKYTVKLTTNVDENHTSATSTSSIVVEKILAPIIVDAPSINVGDDAVITVTLPEDATGTVTIEVGGKFYTESVRNGKAVFVVHGLKVGLHDIKIYYSGDNNYNPLSKDVNLTVKEDKIVVSAPDLVKYYSGSEKFVVYVFYANGMAISGKEVKITINGITYSRTTDENGSASLSINLNSEKYNVITMVDNITANSLVTILPTIEAEDIESKSKNLVFTATFRDGEGKYLKNGTNVSFNINGVIYNSYVNGDKGLVSIDLTLNHGRYIITSYNSVSGENISNNIGIDLKDVDMNLSGDKISVGENATISVTLPDDATGNVTATINGKNYTSHVNNGKADIIIPDLTSGNYTVPITYSGDDMYNGAKGDANITVNKVNAAISVEAQTITVGQNATVTVDLPEDATGSVTVGNEIIPLKSGTASAVLIGLPVGITTVPITYSGDNKYNPAVTAVNITVNDNVAVVISAENLTKYYNGSEKFTVTVTDAEGVAAPNKTVEITINGVTYKRTTDENGTASLNINLDSGEYLVSVVVDDVEANYSITVMSTIDASDVVKIFRNGTQYNAIFTDANGTPLPNIKVSFNIHGIIYNRTTDKNGAAKLDINLDAGDYIITALNSATGEMKSNTIKVISLIESEDLTKYYRNASQFVVRIHSADGGYVGAGEEVKFNINGVFYTRTTNATGHAKLNINLGQGNYTITTYYKDCSQGNNVEVLPILTAENLSMKYMDGSQFKAQLFDGQGKPYADQSVTFNVNGVFYNRQTDSNGVAKLNIRLMAGEYIITSSYNGFNISNTIKITP